MTALPDPPTFDVEAEARAQAEESYRESDTFTTAAIEWVTSAECPGALIELIGEFYDGSRSFHDVIDDALDGEVMW